MEEEQEQREEGDIFQYGPQRIMSSHGKVPKWLIFLYIILPIWGVIWFILYWNGSFGWLDRGYWRGLETAAKTTYPSGYEN